MKAPTTRVKSINEDIIKLNQRLVALKTEKEKAVAESFQQMENLEGLRETERELKKEISDYVQEIQEIVADSTELLQVSSEIIEEKRKITESLNNLIGESQKILDGKISEIQKLDKEMATKRKGLVEEYTNLARQKEDLNILKERLEARGKEINKDYKVII
ncbi:hypothetical protein C4544_05195 [candidate division WS5 bacterium]|uniref:Uncharacterized protein n=1 Tax=candidate division WS5 bacterium TaxID=2093353 RepID=A0A419DBF7_9BACT|nr:MAG: hypothetical protein C4544_05195 [candidate division WS5 bacterium]